MWVGRLGVNLFFVLSGFLITGLLVDSADDPKYYSRFYIRRALRILPAYGVTIGILVATGSAPLKFIFLSLLYLSNLTPLFGVAIAYPVLWSLAVEEHFYLVWPVAARRFGNRLLLLGTAAVVLLSPLARLVSFYLTRTNGFSPFVCNEYTWNSADGLACGAFVAIFLREFKPSRSFFSRALALVFGAALVIWATGIPFGILTRQTPVGAALQVTPWHLAFVALLGLFLLLGTSQHRWLVHIRWLRFLGEISYGLYLYHLLVYNAFDSLVHRGMVTPFPGGPLVGLLSRFAVVSAVAVALSVASRRWIENPFLDLKKRLTSAPANSRPLTVKAKPLESAL
jgi:peptidoglycan/LPS O-acetylase OafA/YrhL